MARVVYGSLKPGPAMELNFIIKKFMEWPKEKRREFYDLVKQDQTDSTMFSGSSAKEQMDTFFSLLSFLLNQEYNDELTECANKTLGLSMTKYFVWPDVSSLVPWLCVVCHYFLDNLKIDGDEVSIEPLVVEG